MRAIMMALALLFGAAVPLAWAEPPEIAAPTPSDVGVRITAAQAGDTVAATAGDSVAVELTADPSAGMSWSVAEQPGFLGDPRTLTGPTTAAQQRPGSVGGARWQVFVFPVSEAGSGALKLELRRAADQGGPAADTFAVTVDAH